MSLFAWFRRSLRMRPKDEFRVQDITFVGEQDGAPEQQLKARLIQLFQTLSTVTKAYLAQAHYEDERQAHIVLCRRADPENKSLLLQIRDIFASQFRRDAHLDIMYVNDDQEKNLQGVCRPFWSLT